MIKKYIEIKYKENEEEEEIENEDPNDNDDVKQWKSNKKQININTKQIDKNNIKLESNVNQLKANKMLSLTLNKRIFELQSENTQLNQNNNKLMTNNIQIEMLKELIEDLKKQNEQLEIDNQQLKEDNQKLSDVNENLKKDNTSLEKENDELKSKIKILEDSMIKESDEDENSQIDDINNEIHYEEIILLKKGLTIIGYNSLPLKSQQFVISELLSNSTDAKENQFLLKLKILQEYLLELNKTESMQLLKISNSNKKLLLELNDQSQIQLLSNVTEILYDEKSFESQEFLNILKYINNLSIEIKYPSDNYKEIYAILLHMKKSKITNLNIGIFIREFLKLVTNFIIIKI